MITACMPSLRGRLKLPGRSSRLDSKERSRGFASARDPAVAVCLLPGTEIAFEKDVRARGLIFQRKIRDRCYQSLIRAKPVPRPGVPDCNKTDKLARMLRPDGARARYRMSITLAEIADV